MADISGASYFERRSLDDAKAAQGMDVIMGLVAVTFLIASLVMFSQAKKQKLMPENPLARGNESGNDASTRLL